MKTKETNKEATHCRINGKKQKRMRGLPCEVELTLWHKQIVIGKDNIENNWKVISTQREIGISGLILK